MVAKSIKLTRAGKEKLEQELEQLIRVKRPQVIDRIRRSRDYGDLSENAEYEDARNEQSFIEGRIQEIELMLKHAEIVENDKKNGEITLGSTVEVLLGGEKLTYEIVSSTESDPLLGKISSDSPIGSALIGKKAGEEVTANTPAGEVTLKIISVK